MNTPFSLSRINMDSFRVNLRRGPPDNAVDDLERQQPEVIETPRQEMAERTPNGSFLPRFAGFRRPTIPSFLSRSSTGTTNRLHRHSQPMPRPTSSYYSDDEVDSPKTPLFNLGMPTMPSTRLHLPHLTRTWTQGSSGPPSRPGTSRGERFPVVTEPVPAVPAEHVRVRGHGHSESRTRFDGADPAELHLASLADDGRRRRRNRSGSDDRTRDPERRHRRRHRHRHREREHRPPPKHFLFCFPWIKSRRIRSQILRCFVSGLFLGLSLTKNISNSEFSVLLILIILFTTIFFCHGLIRLCILIVRPRRDEERRNQLPQMFGPGGYAIPRQPIRVTLARDEEAAGLESEATKSQPPAYGLWRESVRVDPNRIYWQRNEDLPETTEEEGESSSDSGSASTHRPQQGPRPPSYASDDGVSYVVEAQPRSIAPTTDVPLPVHPSEAGRVAYPAGH